MLLMFVTEAKASTQVFLYNIIKTKVIPSVFFFLGQNPCNLVTQ